MPPAQTLYLQMQKKKKNVADPNTVIANAKQMQTKMSPTQKMPQKCRASGALLSTPTENVAHSLTLSVSLVLPRSFAGTGQWCVQLQMLSNSPSVGSCLWPPYLCQDGQVDHQSCRPIFTHLLTNFGHEPSLCNMFVLFAGIVSRGRHFFYIAPCVLRRGANF